MIAWPKKTPICLQINPIECGAVALQIVLEYFGKYIPKKELYEMVGVSKNGSDAHSLMLAAQQLGLKTKAKRGLPEDLKGQELAILFFDNAHFVVFEGYFAGKYYINDPAIGRYQLSKEDLRERFNGVFITLSLPTKRRPLFAKLAIKDTSTKAASLFLGLGLGIIFGVFSLLFGAVVTAGPSFILVLGFIGLSLALLLSAIVIGTRLRLLAQFDIEQQRAELFSSMKKVRPNFFLMRPFAYFKDALEKTSKPELDHRLIKMGSGGILLALLVVQTVVSWQISVLIIVAAFISGLMRYHRVQAQNGFRKTLNASLEQSWINYPDLEAMGQNAFLEQKQMEYELRLLEHSYNFKDHIIVSLSILPFIIVMLFFIALGSTEQAFAVAKTELISSLLLTFGIFYCANLVANNFNTPMPINSFLSEVKSESLNDQERAPLPKDAPLIEISQASFRYGGEKTPLLSVSNLSLLKGRLYGVVGPPGAGVTTLLKLLSNMLSFSVGSMRFHASRWALIDEETELFHGSLWDNVTLFDERVSEHDVVRALYAAHIEELFLKRPMGLLALIEERGKNISVGQKKRLLLARALLHKPDLLVLDDFFDTLDQELAQKILTELKKLPLSVIFSSSRREELALGDDVLMLDAQVIVKSRHENLLNNERYKELLGFRAPP